MLLRVQLLRRRFTATLTVVGLVAFTGCATVPDRPQVIVTGDAVVDGNAQRAAAPVKDRALWDFRVAASALRAANPAEAKLRLDDALPLIGGILANDADAKRARGLFSAESTKTFIGEPYERVMAYYYRGLLYWRDGQPDNARACYRSGQLIDSDAEAVDNKSDYVLLDYLDGFASAKLAGDGSDAFARAQANEENKDSTGRHTRPSRNNRNSTLLSEFHLRYLGDDHCWKRNIDHVAVGNRGPCARHRPPLAGPPTRQKHHDDNDEHHVKLVEPVGCLRETMPAPMWDNLVWLHAPTTLRPQFLAPSFASPSPSATQ